MTMSTDLTFITNEPGKSLRHRFEILLETDTHYFDCLVGCFFISGFYKLYPAMENVEKIRILVGLRTDRAAYELLQRDREQGELNLVSHASAKERVTKELLDELEKSADTADIEKGVQKFVEWIRSGKLEIKAHPSEILHAKVYIMTFAEGDRDKGRVITGSSNLTQAGLQDNLEYNVELKNHSDYELPSASSMDSGPSRWMFQRPTKTPSSISHPMPSSPPSNISQVPVRVGWVLCTHHLGTGATKWWVQSTHPT